MGRIIQPDLSPTQDDFFYGEVDCPCEGKDKKCEKCSGEGYYKPKFPAFIGGYNSGKTYVFVLKGIALALANPGVPGMLVEPTYRLVEDTLQPELEAQLKEYKIAYTYKASKMEYHIHQNGSVIKLRSGDVPESLKGPNIAWCGIDEIGICKKKLLSICVSRVRHKDARYKEMFFAGTPEPVEKGEDWVYELWGTDSGRAKGYYAWHAHTSENKYADEEYIQNLKNSHSDEELIMYLEGKFLTVAQKGRVYKQFDEMFHTERVPYEKGAGKLILSTDFNVDPCVWILSQYSKKVGIAKIIKEFILRDTTTSEMLALTLDYLAEIGVKPGQVICVGDASGENRNTAAEHTNYTLIKKAGFNVRVANSNPRVIPSIGLTNACLRDDKVIVDVSCETLITDLNRVIYKPGENKISKSNPKLTHASDGFRYLIWAIWGKKRVRSRSRKSAKLG